MKAEFCGRCDNYRTSYKLPSHCLLEVGRDKILDAEKVRIRISSPNDPGIKKVRSFMLDPPFTKYLVKVGFPYEHKPRDYNVVFELIDDSDNVIETSEQYRVSTSGMDYIPINTEYTQDSMYVRMLLDNNLIEMSDLSGEFGGDDVTKVDSSFQPEIPDAVRVLRSLYEYIQNFKFDRMTSSTGGVLSESVIDAIETMSGNACTLGLLLCHLGSKLGLDPVMVLTEDTCFVGTSVSKFSLDRTDYDNYVLDYDVSSSVPVQSRAAGKMLMFDVSERSSFSSSVSSAYRYIKSNGIGKNYCFVSSEKKRIELAELKFPAAEVSDE